MSITDREGFLGRGEIDTARTYAASARFSSRDMRRFVIFCPGRTGSELLVSLLDAHPDIRCESELLRETRLYPRRFLRGRAVRGGGGRAVSAWGFKLIDQQLRLWQGHVGPAGELLDALASDGFHVLFLTRRDKLAQTLSIVHAFHHDSWHYEVGEAAPFEPMRVDPAEIISMLHVLDEHERWARNVVARVPHVELFYEDHLADQSSHQATVDRICDDLGVAHHPVTAGIQRGAPPDPRDRVANPRALAGALRLTRFAPLADSLTEEPSTEDPP
jgi:LPS sulfotransferase NodH